MNILKEYGVHATFFHIGYTITSENGDILKRQITEGHAIANHSLSHNFNLLYPGRIPNQSQIISEVDQTNANFQAILGKDFKTRCPVDWLEHALCRCRTTLCSSNHIWKHDGLYGRFTEIFPWNYC